MEQFFTIGILLKAADEATRPITNVSRAMKDLENRTKETLSRFERFKNKIKEVGLSIQNIAGTVAGVGAFATVTNAVMELEDASTMLKSTFMEAGGKIPEVFYAIDREAKKLGTELPGTTADFYKLAATMKQLGVSGEVLAKGGLRAAAYLAVALRIPYEQAGKSVAQFAQALGIAGKDLVAFMDVVQRLGHLGIETTQLSYAFSNLSGALGLVGWQGLEASKKLAPLIGILIQKGKSGERVGTNLANMFEALMKTEKVEKVNEVLRQYGVTLSFIDEATGKLKGPEYVMAELSKVGELIKRGVLSRSEALTLFEQLFGTGEAADFAITFVLEGVEGYNRMVRRMKEQADLQRRVQLATSTLRNVFEAFLGTLQNVFAAIGETIAPQLKALANFLNNVADATERFFKEHRTLASVIAWSIAIFTALSSALLVLGTAFTILGPPIRGAIALLKLFRINVLLARTATLSFTAVKAVLTVLSLLRSGFLTLTELIYTRYIKTITIARIQTLALTALSKLRAIFLGLATAVRVFSTALLMNPIGLIATGIAFAGFLIYKYWDRVKGLWDAVKAKLAAFTSWLSANWKKAVSVFLYINPITAPIMAFSKLINYLRSLNLFEAGKKVILTLVEGIKSVALKPIEAIKNITQRIRNFLPFSPAREGPLRELHKTGFKLVQTIAQTITPTPIVKAVTDALGAAISKITVPVKTVITPVPAVQALTGIFRALRTTMEKATFPTPAPMPAPAPMARLAAAPTSTINVYLGGITVNGQVTTAEVEKLSTDLERAVEEALSRIERRRWRRML